MWNRNNNPLRDFIDRTINKIDNSFLSKMFGKLVESRAFSWNCFRLLIAFTILNLAFFIYKNEYIFDSHYFYDISKGIFVDNIKDFGNIKNMRSFSFNSFKNNAFMFLFPLLMAIFNKIYDVGIFSGTLINYILIFLIYFMNLKISKKTTGDYLCGLFLSFLLINNSSFIFEINTGFSIPITLLFYQCIVHIFLFNEKIEIKQTLLLGLLAGLNINTRFDSILPMLSIILVINLKNKKICPKEMVIFVLCIVVSLLPWIVYSKYFFNVWFATDNSRATIATIPDHLTYYFPSELPNFFNDTMNWIRIYFIKKLPFTTFMFFITFVIVEFYIFPILFLKPDFKKDKNLTWSYAVLSFIFLVLFGGITLSGFFWEIRYYIPIFWFISLIIIFYYPKNKKVLCFCFLILVLKVSFSTFYTLGYHYKNYYKIIVFSNEFYEKNLLKNFDFVGDDEVVLTVYTSRNFNRILGSIKNVKNMELPANIYNHPEYLKSFINEYKFDYIYIFKDNFKKFDLENEKFVMKDECLERLAKIRHDRLNACFINASPIYGLVENVVFEPKIFSILKENFEFIPTKNRNLFKVIRK